MNGECVGTETNFGTYVQIDIRTDVQTEKGNT